MNLEDAEKVAIKEWSGAATKYLKCKVVVLESDLTESHDWGWVFHFKPDQSEPGKSSRGCSVAFDKETEQLVPVGNRGAEFAIHQYRRVRES